MAIEFSSIQIHSRTQGHSAVAAAAYRSCTAITDERTGITHNYSPKENLIYSNILLPDGVDEKFKNRSYLWNEVEKAEKKINARVSRDIVLALPKELSKEEWIILAERFTENEFTSKGVAADIAIHFDKDNPHCHILVTTRRICGDKFTEKARDLNGDIKTSKHGHFSSVNNTYSNTWRDLQNKYFYENNIDITVDQNYLVSQLHEGKVSSEEAAYLRSINIERKEQSREIALNNPEYIINFLTLKESVFTIKDIESVAYKNSKSTEEYNQIITNVLNHKDLVKLGVGYSGKESFTSRNVLNKEQKLFLSVDSLMKNNTHRVKEINIENSTLNQEQISAVKHIVNSNDIALVIGKPGTGKSFMLGKAREVWEEEGYRVKGTTLSGAAAENLQNSSGIHSSTIASLLYRIEHLNEKLNSKDIIVVDEAGMVDLHDMSKLAEYSKRYGSKLVLVGDTEQLQPVGTGAPFRAVKDITGGVYLNDILRQKTPWQNEASRKIAAGDFSGFDDYLSNGKIVFSENIDKCMSDLINDYAKDLKKENLESSIIISHTNKDVDMLNLLARKALERRGVIDGTGTVIQTSKGKYEFSINDKIMFLKNDRTLDVKNGTTGIITNIDQENIRIKLYTEDKREVEFNIKEYNSFSYGYASTVYKLQGSTADKAYMHVSSKAWNRNLALVGMTRHRDDLKIYVNEGKFKSYESFRKTMSKSTFKDSTLNYPVSFSLNRGFDPESVVGRAVDNLAKNPNKIADKYLWLVNRQLYNDMIEYRISLEERNRSEKDYKYAASFIDERSTVQKLYNIINSESASPQDVYFHNLYKEYREKTSLLNEKADTLYNNFEKYEKTLSYYNVTISDLERFSKEYIKETNVKNYIAALENKDKELRRDYALKIGEDIKSHYRYIALYDKLQLYETARKIKEDYVYSFVTRNPEKRSSTYLRAFHLVNVITNFIPQERESYKKYSEAKDSIERSEYYKRNSEIKDFMRESAYAAYTLKETQALSRAVKFNGISESLIKGYAEDMYFMKYRDYSNKISDLRREFYVNRRDIKYLPEIESLESKRYEAAWRIVLDIETLSHSKFKENIQTSKLYADAVNYLNLKNSKNAEEESQQSVITSIERIFGEGSLKYRTYDELIKDIVKNKDSVLIKYAETMNKLTVAEDKFKNTDNTIGKEYYSELISEYKSNLQLASEVIISIGYTDRLSIYEKPNASRPQDMNIFVSNLKNGIISENDLSYLIKDIKNHSIEKTVNMGSNNRFNTIEKSIVQGDKNRGYYNDFGIKRSKESDKNFGMDSDKSHGGGISY